MQRLLVFILLLGTLPVYGQQTESEAPYIYYYSSVYNAFVIERADGTESRLFGDGLMPEETTDIAGPGWSPSGEWFAWMPIHSDTYSSDTYPSHVLNVDGQERLTFFDDWEVEYGNSNSVRHIDWSPVSDLLLAQYDNKIMIIDPNTDTVVNQIDASVRPNVYCTNDGSWGHITAWSRDGSYIVATCSEYDSNENERQFIWILGIDGSPVREIDLSDNLLAGITLDGYITYHLPEEAAVIIDNLFTGETIRVQDNLLLSDSIESFAWSPTGEHALVTLLTGKERLLILLDITAQTLEIIYREAELESNLYHPYLHDMWSPSGEYILYGDRVDKFYIYNLNTKALTQLAENIYAGGVLSEYSRKWEGKSQVYFSSCEESCTTFLYDLETGEKTLQFDIEFLYSGIAFSPDHNYAAYVQRGPIIYDFATSESMAIRPHAASAYSVPGGGVVWHSENEWFIVTEIAEDTHEYLTGVVRVSDGLRRDLGDCGWSRLCTDWLPQNVATYLDEQLPAGNYVPFPQPLFELKGGTDYITRLSWSPDGRFLAAGYGTWIWGNQHWDIVWDVERQTNHPILDSPQYARLDWEIGEGNLYQPILTEIPEGRPLYDVSPDGQHHLLVMKDGVAIVDPTHETVFSYLEELNVWYDLAYNDSYQYSPDGKFILGGSRNHYIGIWDAKTGAFLASVPIYGRGIAFSSDREWVAISNSWDVSVWKTEDILRFAS